MPFAIVHCNPPQSVRYVRVDVGVVSMARAINKLNARQVQTLKRDGRYSDGGGLYLVVGPGASRRWAFLFRWHGKLTEMGLGGVNSVPLARARELATAFRTDLAARINPKEKRDRQRIGPGGVPTFGECADSYIALKGDGWRNAKHRQQWQNTLRDYAAPLCSKAVATITTADVLAVLKPVWKTRPETASRVRGRIESILDAARVNGHIPEGTANPARWRGHLDKLLSRRERVTRGHHAAMPYADAPAFVSRLRTRDTTASLALEFIILTAARSGEALGANWSEINFDARVWIVPAVRMKSGREHRVPLAERTCAILQTIGKLRTSDFVFPGQRRGQPLSATSLVKVLHVLNLGGVTVHGFRSAFRDWAGNETACPREIAEAALGHAVGDETERAYRRGDALDKRRKLMDAWAAFLEPQGASNVIPLACIVPIKRSE
jgi:integrase